MLTYGVRKTDCYPHEFYGGPLWNGDMMERATCYYFKTYIEAAKNAERLAANNKPRPNTGTTGKGKGKGE